MTTYNSYEAAKMAMPLACIIEDTDSGLFFGMPTREGTTLSDGSRFAEPQYYCMTVEKFLADGHKFVDGDALLDAFGGLIVVGSDYTVDGANLKLNTDNKRYILRAVALEEDKPLLQTGEEYEHTKTLNFIYDRLTIVHGENQKFDYMHKLKNAIKMVEGVESHCNKENLQEKPRTKVEYVKCDLSLGGFIEGFRKGLLFYHQGGEYCQIEKENQAMFHAGNDSCFVKKETTMTEREAFIDGLSDWAEDSGLNVSAEVWDSLFDSSLVKLVN